MIFFDGGDDFEFVAKRADMLTTAKRTKRVDWLEDWRPINWGRQRGKLVMNSAETVTVNFATRLYDKLAGTQAGKNLFLSPFSIRVALAMCAAGARGETRQVLADLIGDSKASMTRTGNTPNC